MRKLLNRAAVRHLLSVVVSVILSAALVPHIGPEAASRIGTAAGAVVGG